MYTRIALAFVSAALLTPVGVAEEKSDSEKILGKWEVVSIQRGGRALPDEALKSLSFTFEKGKMIMQRGDQQREFGMKLDPAKKPKAIDVDMMGKTGEGIYSLEGDSLKICHGEEGDPRPAEMASKEGTNVTLITLKRAK
jgi:uncharacterized protein (TIGR03067 family)